MYLPLPQLSRVENTAQRIVAAPNSISHYTSPVLPENEHANLFAQSVRVLPENGHANLFAQSVCQVKFNLMREGGSQ